LWNDFGEWNFFNKTNKFKHHCRKFWKKILHSYEQEEKVQKKPLNLDKILQKHSDDKLFVADETTKKVRSSIHLEGYKHIFDPIIIKNAKGETMIDFFDLANSSNIKITREAVNKYYDHNINNPSHQSNQFKKDKIEYYGCFADSNILPYVTANTASTHNHQHQKCVQELINGLQPLSDVVNNYIKNTYPVLYTKMEKLDLGPNVPKSFGSYPTASINFNSICQFHRDLQDHRNTLCVVCPLGIFEGGQLVFPELKLIFNIKEGQAIAFRSRLLVHGNLPIINGNRHSVVFYIHHTLVKQERPFNSFKSRVDNLNINSDSDDSDEDNEQLPSELNPPKNLKNSRRSYIGKYYIYIKIYNNVYNINIFIF
jgi:hypothetical protein